MSKKAVNTENNEEILFYKKASLFRVITNSTTNVLLIIFFLVLLTQYLLPSYKETLIPLIVMQAGCLVLITIITIFDYRSSYLKITNKKVVYTQGSKNPKKWIDLDFNEISEVYCSSYNVIVKDKNGQKYKIEVIAKPKEICNEILKHLKK